VTDDELLAAFANLNVWARGDPVDASVGPS
jgi:hypothetical protein